MHWDIPGMISFIRTHGGEYYKQYASTKLAEILALHIKYKTILCVDSNIGIVCVARWNWKSKVTVLVLDCITHPNYRSPRMIRQIVALAVSANPSCKYIEFDREAKNRTGRKKYRVDDLLKRRKHEYKD